MSGAGARRHRLAFEAPTRTRNAFGEDEATAWAERHATWGELIYHSGGEALEAARLAGRQVFKVKIRNVAGTPASEIAAGWRMRLTSKGTAWDVKEADAVTQRAFVFLVVEGPLPE